MTPPTGAAGTLESSHASEVESPDATGELTRLSARDSARVLTQLLLPTAAKGPIIRRPAPMKLSERHGWDRRALALMAELRERYGDGPVMVTTAARPIALLLTPDGMSRALDRTPDPFTPDTLEKRWALGQFQPHGSLISRGGERRARRRVNEKALEMTRPMHSAAPEVTRRAAEEASATVRRALRHGVLGWDEFNETWWRAVRRIVLGEAAADDTELTRRLDVLRSAANLSLLRTRQRARRDEFLLRVHRYAFAAEPGTIAHELHEPGIGRPEADPVGQIPHWMFAYEPAGMVTYRALALLAGHPRQAAEAVREVREAGDPVTPHPLPYLRACVRESVRLWHTTPLLLRETTEPTRWPGGTMPAGTLVVAYTPWFQRGGFAAPYENSFAPEQWISGEAEENPALVPFSDGPGRCPGENLVLLTASSWLAGMMAHTDWKVISRPAPRAGEPIPALLDHFTLYFSPRPRPTAD
ncbi:cytochrome P450 [Streptomyces calidiresistens]|uniref:Cytochrome P450 n=1 Tax=Streptomyces calidiresistens TaxID=1485586 RepID=A0A7W3T6K4_9ACTN|nr:cytochrome P450 [Streptomyces calidiresistens]MBB0231895.1 cytochrome P450 [Streptomyces calidiresistens]